MSPRRADPSVRTALIDAAARVLAEEGTAALTLRRLAAEVGSSTMAVYTHFGSMDEVRRAVRQEAFARFADRLAAASAAVAPVDDGTRGARADPLRILASLGAAYLASAVEEPHMYRAMFLDGPVDEADAATGLETFAILVTAVQGALDAGCLSGGPADRYAFEIWAFTHGLVTLRLAGLVDDLALADHFRSGSSRLLWSMGADPGHLARLGGDLADPGRAPVVNG